MLTSLYLTQTLAQGIADMHANKWVLMFLINIFLLVCGFFIPPALGLRSGGAAHGR